MVVKCRLLGKAGGIFLVFLRQVHAPVPLLKTHIGNARQDTEMTFPTIAQGSSNTRSRFTQGQVAVQGLNYPRESAGRESAEQGCIYLLLLRGHYFAYIPSHTPLGSHREYITNTQWKDTHSKVRWIVWRHTAQTWIWFR